MEKIVECVPNFSEGCDQAVIQAIAAAAATTPDVKVLDVDSGADFNRTVYTFVGTPEHIVEGAIRAARVGITLIDMTTHKGEHARMGALDVCPFIPIKGVTDKDCIALSKEFGKRLADELQIPVFLYAKSASREDHIRLPNIREGEYEALEKKFQTPDYIPDYGPKRFIPKSGATATGCRDILLAYNVNLATNDKTIANKISGMIRTSGVPKRDENGEKIIGPNGKAVRMPGLFKGVQAGGMMYNEDIAQVSMNLLNYTDINMHTVYDKIKELAGQLGTTVTGSEIVGLVPLESLLLAGRHYAEQEGLTTTDEDILVDLAIKHLGLSDLATFDPRKKIIEYMVEDSLTNDTINTFLDTTASNAPAPGGGSVAALSGALGAALSSMVANLTLGKEKYADVQTDMQQLLQGTENLRRQLTSLIDKDTNAFNDVMTAFKMPKETEKQKQKRSAAIQAGYKKAASVPLTTAETCAAILDLALIAAQKGNPNSISDAAVSALMAQAGVHGALLNVSINLGSIKDTTFVSEMQQKITQLKKTTDTNVQQILTYVEGQL